jgi:hypothetical protein
MAKLGKGAKKFLVVNPDKQHATGYALRADGCLLQRDGDGYRVRLSPKKGVDVSAAKEAIERLKGKWRDKGCEIIEGGTEPTFGTLMDWCFECVAGAIDGCRVEPDGTCPHGYAAWTLAKGLL